MSAQEQWFKASVSWHCSISAVDVVKHTAKMITYVEGTRVHCSAIQSNRTAFFRTWDGAHTWLVSIADHEVQEARQRLQRAQTRYEAIKGMERESCLHVTSHRIL